jgi:hypothetical protein
MKNFKSKCACSAGAIGICLCIIFMSIGAIGITLAGISKNSENIQGEEGSMGGMSNMSDMSGMSAMTSMNTTTASNSSFQSMVMSFFMGFWGEVTLLFSFLFMILGMWFSNNKKIVPVSILASIILYISMYAYYSIPLEIAGLIIMVFAYVTAFNQRARKACKLV